MKKVIRLTESDLTRLVRRVIKESNLLEQFNMDDMGTSSDEPKPMDRPSLDDAKKSNLINNVIPMLEEIVSNFMDINCDNVGPGYEDYDKTPEYVQTYCRYYNGKTRSDIFRLLKKLKQQVNQ